MSALADTRRRLSVDRLPALLAALGGLVVIALAYGIFSGITVMGADFASYVLPAIGRAQGHGAVYADYFDVKPPLIYGLFVPWVALGGPSLAGLWVLYALLLGAMMTGFWFALRQDLSPWLALVVFGISAVVVVHIGALEEFFFTTEVVGLVAVLWGLVIARWRGDRPGWLFLAAVLMGMAGQVKEIFILAPLALLPIALVPISGASMRRWRAIGAIVAGVATALAATAALLLWWGGGAFAAYLDVLGVKRDRFPAPTPAAAADLVAGYLGVLRTWLPFLAVFVVVLVVIGIATAVGSARRPAVSSPWRLSPGEWSVVVLVAGIAIAFVWQGSLLTGYHAIALVYPLYLFLAVLLARGLAASASMTAAPRIVVSALLIIGLLPSVAGVVNAASRTVSLRPAALAAAFTDLESRDDLAVFDGVRELGAAGGCLQVVAGWEASATYVYADMPPCSRFVLPPLVGMHPALAAELEAALLAQPPAVLVVDRTWLDNGDPDYSMGASVDRAMADAADACYRPTDVSPSVLVPDSDDDQTRACLTAAFANASG